MSAVLPLRLRPLLKLSLMLSLSASPLFVPTSFAEDAAARRSYQVPAGSLSAALTRFAGLSGVNLSVDPALVSGRSSSGLSGEYGVEEGFARLLQGSGLQLQPMGEQAYMLVPAPDGRHPGTGADLYPRHHRPVRRRYLRRWPSGAPWFPRFAGHAGLHGNTVQHDHLHRRCGEESAGAHPRRPDQQRPLGTRHQPGRWAL